MEIIAQYGSIFLIMACVFGFFMFMNMSSKFCIVSSHCGVNIYLICCFTIHGVVVHRLVWR